MNKNKIITVLILVLLIGAFIGGRMSKSCVEVVDSIVTTTTVDTIVTEKKKDLHWINHKVKNGNPLLKALRIAYPTIRPDSLPNIRLSEPLNPLESTLMERRWVTDSISTQGVGLRFEHLIRGEIEESKYTIRYPEVHINTVSSTTKTLVRKQAFGVGFIAISGLRGTWYQNFEFAPVIGYRYDKLQIKGGYGVVNKSVVVGVYREF